MSDSKIKIALPETDDEKALCEILGGVLGTDSVGVTTDLFDLGLSSLGALRLVSEAEKKGIKLDLVDVAEYRTVRGILEALPGRQSEAAKEDYALSEERERKLPHPVTHVMNTWLNDDAGNFHWPYLISFDPEVDAQRLCDALNKAMANRTALSMVIETDSNGEAFVRYDCSLTPRFEVQRLTEAEFEAKRVGLLHTFEIYGSPLVHAGVFETEERVYLFLDIHHMIMDGMGMTLLCDDIEKAYRGEAMSQDTYFTWLAADHSSREKERSQAKYRELRDNMLRLLDDEKTHIGFAPDKSGDMHDTVIFPHRRVITKAEFHSLVECFRISEGILSIGLTSLTAVMVDGEGDCLGSTVYHNRGDDVSRNAFGSLITDIPFTIKVKRNSSVAAFFKDLKASYTDSIENTYVGTDVMCVWPGGADILLTVFQALETVGSGFLSSLGGKMEKIERVMADVKTQIIQFLERPDGQVSIILTFDRSHYSSEKLAAIQDALDKVIDRLVAVKDPEAVTLEELFA